LRSFCREFSALTNLHVEFSFEGQAMQIPTNATLCCFRVVQEGLRNVVRHARATRAQVKVVATSDRLFLVLGDDGIGVGARSVGAQNGLGISSMKERVELLSGDFRIGDRMPHGTLLMAVLPL